ncbi:hypothetical protein GA0070607_4708 [Micromonospora coriariae]|uniref:Uncharacterized protein n=1 Tax=Micromonospora coriariae TaxID=285665 RepID=A0A1C4X5E8_9ACTN|nr:hypothetical protein [Micromonospora coriariae]SCF03672.1 hypothetical protein GA0070607_4708 [Micromonospora coriariae]
MTHLNRRNVIQLTALSALGGSVLGELPAAADGLRRPGQFGPASLSAAIVGMAVDGTTGYFVTRGQTPPKVVTYDIVSRTVTDVVSLERGDGGWACTVSGGKVYIGTYSFGDIVEYDPATRVARRLGTIGPSGTIVFAATTAPDGVVYFGTYPRGEVWSLQPATGTLTNLGRAFPGSQYARLLAADETYVYAGTIPAHIVRIDRSTGAKVDIMPVGTALDSGLGALAAGSDRVYAASSFGVHDIARDGSGYVEVPADEEYLVDSLTVTGDGGLLALGRLTGSILRREGDRLARIAQGPEGDEGRGVALLPDGTVFAANGSGRVSILAPGRNTVEQDDLTNDARAAGPELLQSMCAAPDGSVYVGGHFAITVHEPARGISRRYPVAGEAKDIAAWRNRMISALYPSGEVIDLDPRTGRVRSFGRIDNNQQRPWDVVHHKPSGLVLIASAPRYGSLQGALTLLDPATGKMEVRLDILPNQALNAIALDGDMAYIAGDTWGGNGIPPTEPTAQVAVFDISRREVVDRFAPLPDQPSMQHVEVLNGVLYALYKRTSGSWLAYDLATRTVLRSGKLSGYGEIVAHRGRIYAGANFGDNIYLLGPGLESAVRLHTGIGTNWYTVPRIEPVLGARKAWAAVDRNLALIELPS